MILSQGFNMSKEQTDWVMVPRAALDWLNGEGPDPAGYGFGEFPEDQPKPRGAFWWRSIFRDICSYYRRTTPPEAQAVAFIVHDDPELGDYLTRSRQAADASGKPVTPLYASPSPAGGVQGVTVEMRSRAIAAAIAAGEYCTQGYVSFPADAIVDAVLAALSSQAQTTGGVE